MSVTCPSRPLVLTTAISLALLTSPTAQAGPSTEELKQQINELGARITQLKQTIMHEEAALQEIRSTLDENALSEARGLGPALTPQTTAATASSNTQPHQPAQPAPPTSAPLAAAGPATDNGDSLHQDNRPPQVAALFDQPGVLTPRGRFVLEPSQQYTYASSSRVALVGYTIIPALVIGLIDVREVKRNTMTTALTGRWGISNRFEMEAKLPLVYRSDDTLERPLSSGSAQDTLFSSSGKGLGDVEMTGRYQLNDGGIDKVYYVGSLRFKSRTGKDPFEITTATSVPGGGLNTQLQRQLPTGSGFYTLQPGITALFATDPAVFFGSLSYQYNFARDNLSLQTDDGPQYVGKIKPGDVLGFSFGMGLALNDKASFSLGYDHSAILKTKINDVTAQNSLTTQLGTLLLGFSYRLSERTTMNLSLGIGATRDAPDMQLAIRIPVSF